MRIFYETEASLDLYYVNKEIKIQILQRLKMKHWIDFISRTWSKVVSCGNLPSFSIASLTWPGSTTDIVIEFFFFTSILIPVNLFSLYVNKISKNQIQQTRHDFPNTASYARGHLNSQEIWMQAVVYSHITKLSK